MDRSNAELLLVTTSWIGLPAFTVLFAEVDELLIVEVTDSEPPVTLTPLI
jgi:hypothetical protein